MTKRVVIALLLVDLIATTWYASTPRGQAVMACFHLATENLQ